MKRIKDDKSGEYLISRYDINREKMINKINTVVLISADLLNKMPPQKKTATLITG